MDPAGPCPALRRDPTVQSLVAEKQREDDEKVAELIAKGVQPVRVVYADGGQNPYFSGRVSDLSRPDALAAGPTEIDDRRSEGEVERREGRRRQGREGEGRLEG